MLSKITYKDLIAASPSKIKIDRILIFVDSISEIQAFRALHLYYFEFVMRNLEPGIVSSIFFLRDINFELVWLKNQELAYKYIVPSNFYPDFHLQPQNQTVPFAFILSYSSTIKNPKSKRRCYHLTTEKIDNTQSATKVNFSLSNLKNLQEPTCYIVPESLTSDNLLDSSSLIKRKLLCHQSLHQLTDIQVTLNNPELSSKALSLISALDLIKIKRGDFLQLELIFNQKGKRQFFLTPFSSIPIIFYY